MCMCMYVFMCTYVCAYIYICIYMHPSLCWVYGLANARLWHMASYSMLTAEEVHTSSQEGWQGTVCLVRTSDHWSSEASTCKFTRACNPTSPRVSCRCAVSSVQYTINLHNSRVTIRVDIGFSMVSGLYGLVNVLIYDPCPPEIARI